MRIHTSVMAPSFIFSMWVSTMRLTSSAIEMPSRLASRFRNILCGSVNEIICFVIVERCHYFQQQGCAAIRQVYKSLHSRYQSFKCVLVGRHGLVSFNASSFYIYKEIEHLSTAVEKSAIDLFFLPFIHGLSIPKGIQRRQ